MRIAAIALCSLITGCAELEQMQQQSMASEVSSEPSDNLCVVALVRPNYRQLALAELKDRGYSCDWPQAQARAQVWLAQRSANNAATINAIQGYVNSANAQTNALNAGAAAAAQQNKPINCFSRPGPAGVWTSCQ